MRIGYAVILSLPSQARKPHRRLREARRPKAAGLREGLAEAGASSAPNRRSHGEFRPAKVTFQ